MRAAKWKLYEASLRTKAIRSSSANEIRTERERGVGVMNALSRKSRRKPPPKYRVLWKEVAVLACVGCRVHRTLNILRVFVFDGFLPAIYGVVFC